MMLTIPVPNPRQEMFFRARERFVAYGGARGGGKSWAVRVKALLMALYYPGIRILIVRRTYPELRANHIEEMRSMCRGIAEYRELDKMLRFFNTSRICFGYCADESDADRYQGQEYDAIFIDEATQITERMFRKITACMRGVNAFPKRCFLTCNPGGIGHAWVKRLFIDREFERGETPADYAFIPAGAGDNTALIKSDPGYLEMLRSLPEDLRRAWLDGDWDALSGQYFCEFRRDRHVCEPFEIPIHWRRYFAMDYGLDMLAGLWAAFDDAGRCYVYREVYKSDLIVSQAAREILAYGDEVYAYLAPGDIWGRSADTGKSRAERFGEEGLYLTRVIAESRTDGWLEVKEWLGGDTPGVRIFSTCRNLIRTLPLLQHDEHNPSDCATEPHELTHAPDALRYLLAGRPAPGVRKKENRSVLPFALQTQEKQEGGYFTW